MPLITQPTPLDPQSPPHKHEAFTKDRKSLAIAILVAAGFLLAALSIAIWLFVQKQGDPSANIVQNDPKDTTKVTSVSWVAPELLPAGYVLSDQSTVDSQVAYYADSAAGCSITTRVAPAASNIQEAVVEANDSTGIGTNTVADTAPLAIADAEIAQQYEFIGLEADQTVAVPGVEFDKQSSAIYYKQFGSQVASAIFTCKLAVFEAKTEELKALIAQFKVRTQR